MGLPELVFWAAAAAEYQRGSEQSNPGNERT
jgi:hypothetical protein